VTKAAAEQNANLSSDKEPAPIREVDPKEWHQIHDDWLHLAMCTAMGNATLQSIPDIENIKTRQVKKQDPKDLPPPTSIKALHVDINKTHQGVNCSRIKFLYSSKAMVFPLGIKM